MAGNDSKTKRAKEERDVERKRCSSLGGNRVLGKRQAVLLIEFGDW